MELLIKIIAIMFGVVFVLGVYNKIQSIKESKRLMDLIQKDKEKNRRPNSSYTFTSDEDYK
jgi:hypothetical protein